MMDFRQRFFTGKIQDRLFQRLQRTGELSLEDVRSLYGSRDAVLQFIALVQEVGVGRVDYKKTITGRIIYLPEAQRS